MIGENTHRRGLRQSVDWKLIGVYILLVLIGWVNIYASVHSESPSSIFDWSVRSGKQGRMLPTGGGHLPVQGRKGVPFVVRIRPHQVSTR